MRLASIATPTGYSLGIVQDGRVLDLPEIGRWPVTMRALAAAGPQALAAIASWAAGTSGGRPVTSVRLGPAIPDPGKIVAIGLNYADHAAEGNLAVPRAPLIFAKFPSTIVGPDEDVTWDRSLTDRVDFEAELGVVIGARARNVAESAALDHVFGYTCVNDVTARDLQFGDGQWIRGKSLDTFCPVGPWIVTADEIPDPQALTIACLVNGETRQSSSTANMFFGVREIVAHCSRAFTLEPGDLIATGTPAGVGVFAKPPRLLRDGDEMVVRIQGIGDLRNTCRTTGEPVAAADPG
jgi:2-keto-4-pentenoate hydratase/2-oxohepta-3-ene-1,7-dioic acid hydratase in catechol pathway